MPVPSGNRSLSSTRRRAGSVRVALINRIDWFMWNHESDATRAQTVAARPGGEPPAQVLVTKRGEATGHNLTSDQHEVASQAVQYSIGIGPAIGYALLRQKLPGRGIARGAAYGAALFVAQDKVLNTLNGLGGNLLITRGRRMPTASSLIPYTVLRMSSLSRVRFTTETLPPRRSVAPSDGNLR